MRRKNKNESGQSVVIMAFAIVILMGILAVAIDGGRLYTLRRDAQNAADAAALQGARALCRDEDFVAKALEVAEINGFSGAGVVEVNNPPVRSDSPNPNDDQVEVVITATIDGGMIAPVIYQGELNTRVLAVGDCLRGTLTGSGAAIFAGGICPTNSVGVGGSSVSIIGGIHSNGDMNVSGGGIGHYITGTVTYGTGTNLPANNTTLFPATNNPVQVSFRDYPIDLVYADFVVGGAAYDAVMEAFPNGSRYHYYDAPGTNPTTESDLVSQGWLTGTLMKKGLYVSPDGFKFTGSDVIGDDVTLIADQGKITLGGGNPTFRPYFGGLLMMTMATGDPCDNNKAINLTPASLNWGGIIFAPNGSVALKPSGGGTFFGSIIAGQVDLSGADLMVIYDPSFLPPDPDTIELGE
jgi:hypothetical protein